ncbi:MAG TPA: alpha-amylase family glycosyl hydrolase [Sandaracinaceae bacterium LLY-WYZ-13_1]|nr:alpha-amylase family glycosyl hydrolase [Sandaracinaceae bacterium LLY-WYZ-13_1]
MDDDGGAAVDGGSADGGTGDDAGAPADVRWAARSCDLTLRHAPRVGASSVQVAGEFTGWGDAPIEMRDDDRDGTYEVTLSPSPRLTSGQLYAYRFVVDGDYVLDASSAYRKLDDACLNSAFRMPACDAGPAIRAGELSTTYDGASDTGRASVRIQVLTARDGAPPASVRVRLDDAPVEGLDGTLDRGAGAYDVALEGLAPGRHVLRVRVTDTEDRVAEPVDLPFWIEEEPFEWRDALMYMIVVDRFANGDTDIDAPVGAPVEYPADFHGGDLWGALEVMRSGYFDDLGVNVIWLSPINQQAEGHFEGRDGSRRYAGYHGYWPSRGRAVEPRFGGNEALRAFVQEAHARGIRVLFDLINNQIHEQHEYYDDHPGWFRTGCVCGVDPGCGWSERPLDCLFAPYLPDIDWRVPGAERQFIDDAVFWIDELGIDGFRIDAVKHVETNSIYNLRAALSRRFEQGGERLFLVGETAVGESDSVDYGCGESYPNGYAWIDAYVGDNALDGQFDFPTHHALQGGLVADSMPFSAVEDTVRTLETRYDPAGLHVRFLGTHDSNRMASRAARDPAQGCRWPGGGACSSLPETPTDPAAFARLERAFTVLYTIPGIPFLYYGDEIAMPGGNDPDNRRDMVWTGALSSLAMGDTSLSAAQESLRAHLRELGQARRDSEALRRGRRVPLLVTDDLYVYAWAHDDPGQLALVAVNRGAAVTDRRVDTLTGSMLGAVTGFDRAAGDGAVTLDGTRLRLTLGAGASAVFLGR